MLGRDTIEVIGTRRIAGHSLAFLMVRLLCENQAGVDRKDERAGHPDAHR